MWEDPEFSIAGWLAGMLGLVTVAVNARRVVAYFSDRSGDRLRPSFDLVALMVAVLLFCVTLTVTNALSHGIAWSFKYPYHVPEKLVTRTPTEAGGKAALTQSCSLEESPCPDSAELGGLPCTECPEPGERCLLGPAGVLGFLAVLSFVFGHTWPFLNNSTLLPLYSARLTRAYLGASNPCRVSPRRKTPPPQGKEIEDCPPPVAVTRVTPGDDMSIEKCWWKSVEPQDEDPFRKGAPLHLVNVTINETLAGESQVQHGDRKGIGMAIGPAGISAGVQHHVVFRQSSEGRRLATIFPKAQTRKAGETAIECRPFRMFAYGASSTGSEGEVCYAGRPLSLGQWTGISGAAFSTGLGLRTSLGLSLLAGFFNVRLGLWWDSGVDPGERGSAATRETGSGRLGRWVSWLLPVQSYLVDEFFIALSWRRPAMVVSFRRRPLREHGRLRAHPPPTASHHYRRRGRGPRLRIRGSCESRPQGADGFWRRDRVSRPRGAISDKEPAQPGRPEVFRQSRNASSRSLGSRAAPNHGWRRTGQAAGIRTTGATPALQRPCGSGVRSLREQGGP